MSTASPPVLTAVTVPRHRHLGGAGLAHCRRATVVAAPPRDASGRASTTCSPASTTNSSIDSPSLTASVPSSRRKCARLGDSLASAADVEQRCPRPPRRRGPSPSCPPRSRSRPPPPRRRSACSSRTLRARGRISADAASSSGSEGRVGSIGGWSAVMGGLGSWLEDDSEEGSGGGSDAPAGVSRRRDATSSRPLRSSRARSGPRGAGSPHAPRARSRRAAAQRSGAPATRTRRAGRRPCARPAGRGPVVATGARAGPAARGDRLEQPGRRGGAGSFLAPASGTAERARRDAVAPAALPRLCRGCAA